LLITAVEMLSTETVAMMLFSGCSQRGCRWYDGTSVCWGTIWHSGFSNNQDLRCQ